VIPLTQPDSGTSLALVSARGWPALVTERLGGWLLQAADGFTGRANSVVPCGDPGLPLAEALAVVQDFYARVGLPARIQVVVGSPLEAQLSGRGWVVVTSGKEAYATSEVQVARLEEMLARLDDAPTFDVDLGNRVDDAWLALYGRTTTPSAARHVLTSPERLALARVVPPPDAAGAPRTGPAVAPATPPGRPEVVGIGRGVVTGPWLGVSAVEVASTYRRRGIARAIMARIGRWGREHGASWVYLQVGSDNVAAKALYGRLGFALDHHYRYYAPQPD
jgi:N-acetylglutamate synthase